MASSAPALEHHGEGRAPAPSTGANTNKSTTWVRTGGMTTYGLVDLACGDDHSLVDFESAAENLPPNFAFPFPPTPQPRSLAGSPKCSIGGGGLFALTPKGATSAAEAASPAPGTLDEAFANVAAFTPGGGLAGLRSATGQTPVDSRRSSLGRRATGDWFRHTFAQSGSDASTLLEDQSMEDLELAAAAKTPSRTPSRGNSLVTAQGTNMCVLLSPVVENVEVPGASPIMGPPSPTPQLDGGEAAHLVERTGSPTFSVRQFNLDPAAQPSPSATKQGPMGPCDSPPGGDTASHLVVATHDACPVASAQGASPEAGIEEEPEDETAAAPADATANVKTVETLAVETQGVVEEALVEPEAVAAIVMREADIRKTAESPTAALGEEEGDGGACGTTPEAEAALDQQEAEMMPVPSSTAAEAEAHSTFEAPEGTSPAAAAQLPGSAVCTASNTPVSVMEVTSPGASPPPRKEDATPRSTPAPAESEEAEAEATAIKETGGASTGGGTSSWEEMLAAALAADNPFGGKSKVQNSPCVKALGDTEGAAHPPRKQRAAEKHALEQADLPPLGHKTAGGVVTRTRVKKG